MSYTLSAAGLNLGHEADTKIKQLFSRESELQCAIAFEKALCAARANAGLIPEDHAAQILELLNGFQIDFNKLSPGITNDGIYVPEFVKQVKQQLPAEIASDFHKQTTSQDVIDTSLMMRLQTAQSDLKDELSHLIKTLDELKQTIGARPISARTRMQAALPCTLENRINLWRKPLHGLIDKAPGYFPLQLGGPIGLMHQQETHWKKIAEHMSAELGLSSPDVPWQTDRQPVVDHCAWFTSVTSALGKLGTDITLMAQNEIEDIKLDGGGTSSAMPHKNNPIRAEFLVAAARFNAGQMGLMHQASIHEQERSGAAWSLEFMLVPQIVVMTASAVKTAPELVHQLR